MATLCPQEPEQTLMRVDQFDFLLPADRIPDRPVNPRDSARLLHVHEAGLSDLSVRDLPGLLRDGDVLVFNDTRVIPARLYGKRGQSDIEFLLHRPESAHVWHALARPAKRLKPGDAVTFSDTFSAEILGRNDDGSVRIRFDLDPEALSAALEKHGHMPLPPYMGREDDAQDREDYQTIYASHDGAVAAPTAGLHFTDDLMDALSAKGIETSFLTLHVGLGTFQPMKVDDTDDHVMHREWAQVSQSVSEQLTKAKADGRRIVAVGTTSLRTLESAAETDGEIRPFAEETDLFIVPGYRFKAVDALMTNFHLPKSTLFMLVSAFAGTARMKAAYDHAIKSGYRFYSYGDACLLDCDQLP
jgi:S-adenosylmethionine:tRNA ribosyltransferase-isomerase